MVINNHNNSDIFLSTNSVTDLLRLLEAYPPANQETNLKLFEEFKNGSLEAREQIILRNIKLVISRIRHLNIKTNSMQFSDLLSEGISGLMRSIEDYNPEKGAFSTYASTWIDQRIRKSLDTQDDEIRLASHAKQAVKRYMKYISTCEANGREIPCDEELEDILGISAETLDVCKNYIKYVPISMQTKLDDSDDLDLERFIPSEERGYKDVLDKMVDIELMAYLKWTLSPRDYYILYHRVLTDEPKSLDAIAKDFNLSRERVRQIQKRVIK